MSFCRESSIKEKRDLKKIMTAKGLSSDQV
jgi:hypothetical protein